MKHVLILGAGRVARPCVQYLLRQEDIDLTVVDITKENLDRVTEGHPRTRTIVADAGQESKGLISSIKPNIVINLLPPAFMASIAKQCLEAKINLVHPNYLDAETLNLDSKVKSAGLTFIAELGLDPGIDHMSAIRTIRDIRQHGGQVESFRSICGALPSAEANTNPWGYKLSWSPSSLIGACKRDARIKLDGQVFEWLGGETYKHVYLEEVKPLGWYEIYANADALPYVERYGIPEVKTIYRGTIRYVGWCETVVAMNALGLVEETLQDFSDLTFRGFMARQVGEEDEAKVEEAVCRKLGICSYNAVFQRFAWLGLFDDQPLPFEKGSARDVISFLFNKKLVFDEGERDLVILKDNIVAFYPGSGKRLRHTSTLIDFGIPNGDTSIARTTGLPMAIAAKLILEGKICVHGVLTPVVPEIALPVLDGLEQEGIVLTEKSEELNFC